MIVFDIFPFVFETCANKRVFPPSPYKLSSTSILETLFVRVKCIWKIKIKTYICAKSEINIVYVFFWKSENRQNRIFAKICYAEKIRLVLLLVKTWIFSSGRIFWTEFWPFYVFLIINTTCEAANRFFRKSENRIVGQIRYEIRKQCKI